MRSCPCPNCQRLLRVPYDSWRTGPYGSICRTLWDSRRPWRQLAWSELVLVGSSGIAGKSNLTSLRWAPFATQTRILLPKSGAEAQHDAQTESYHSLRRNRRRTGSGARRWATGASFTMFEGRIRRHWQVKRWLYCVLDFSRRRHRMAMTPQPRHRTLLPRRSHGTGSGSSTVCRTPPQPVPGFPERLGSRDQ